MDIVFVCGARDFHAMDKFRLTKKAIYPKQVVLLTDLIESEGYKKLIKDDDKIFELYNIDILLFKKQSNLGNIWRNIIKLLLIPIQVKKLKKFYATHPNSIYHAITMYYMIVCYMAKIPYVATPQGSEILVRPDRSSIYKKFAIKALRAADKVVVDSLNMSNKVTELCGITPLLLKNGFNTDEILKTQYEYDKKYKLISIRGMTPFYRIDTILEARNQSEKKPEIALIYPFCNNDYKKSITYLLNKEDKDLGKLEKPELYGVFKSTLLAVSIPESDSSPRSVYECIFSGACVAITYAKYYEELPSCMKSRVFLKEIDDPMWLDKALKFALQTTKKPFIPTKEALDMCDENRTIKKIIHELYSQPQKLEV